MNATFPHASLPTSGRPAVPVTPPPPQATFDLAWRYGRDLVRLNLVDPEKVQAFWEVTDATALRSSGRPGRLAVRLQRLGEPASTVALHEGIFAVQTWYWEVEPRARYRAELGWQSASGFEVWVASNEVETPSLEPHVTDQVVWRTKRSRDLTTAPRGEPTFVAGEGSEDGEGEPSERPRDAASAAGARRRAQARELARPGDVRAWSRTAIPTRPEGGQKP